MPQEGDGDRKEEGEEVMYAYELQWYDHSRSTAVEKDQISVVYSRIFAEDIGLTFNPELDADFLYPCKYYSEESRGAFIVCLRKEKRKDGSESGEVAIVGTAGLRALPDVGPDVCEVKRMFLLPEARGRGLAPVMMEMLLDRAKNALNFTRMVLDTKKVLVAANKLYERYGFNDIENYNGNPRADRFMARDL